MIQQEVCKILSKKARTRAMAKDKKKNRPERGKVHTSYCTHYKRKKIRERKPVPKTLGDLVISFLNGSFAVVLDRMAYPK